MRVVWQGRRVGKGMRRAGMWPADARDTGQAVGSRLGAMGRRQGAEERLAA